MLLGVNIDHVATLRNARGGNEPDVLTAVRICKECQVASITTHLREDRRHIKDADVEAIRMLPRVRLNLEMAMLKLTRKNTISHTLKMMDQITTSIQKLTVITLNTLF